MWRKINKFISIPSEERNLFLRIYFMLFCVRIVIVFFPMRKYSKWLGEKGKELDEEIELDKKDIVKKVIKANRRAIRHLPGKTKCLAQAITIKRILSKKGIKSTLYLGVGKESKNNLIAHAWLKCGKTIITGVEDMPKFTPVAFFT